jgi:hypothetical protein
MLRFPSGSGCFLRDLRAFPSGELSGTRFATFGSSQRRKCLCVRVLVLGRLEHVTDGFFDYAEGVLRHIRTFTASACSGRHAGSITRSNPFGEGACCWRDREES